MTKGDKNPNVLFLLCTVSVFPALWLHISSQRERERERQREKEGQKGFRLNTKSWIELLSNYTEKSWRNYFHSEIASKFPQKKQQVTMI